LEVLVSLFYLQPSILEHNPDTGEVEFTVGSHGEKEVGNPLFKEEIQRYKYNGILPMDIK
jgi:hypothetical protein